MKITIEMNKADEIALVSASADKDMSATIQKMERGELFKALKCEIEFRMRLASEGAAAGRGVGAASRRGKGASTDAAEAV